MEDVHALVRAVSKTQTEFGIKHISYAIISRNLAKQAVSMLRLVVMQVQPAED